MPVHPSNESGPDGFWSPQPSADTPLTIVLVVPRQVPEVLGQIADHSTVVEDPQKVVPGYYADFRRWYVRHDRGQPYREGHKVQGGLQARFRRSGPPDDRIPAGIELISGKKLGPDSAEIKAKRKDGTVVGTYWMTLSADGKMRITLTWLGAEVTGPPARVSIHKRQ